MKYNNKALVVALIFAQMSISCTDSKKGVKVVETSPVAEKSVREILVQDQEVRLIGTKSSFAATVFLSGQGVGTLVLDGGQQRVLWKNIEGGISLEHKDAKEYALCSKVYVNADDFKLSSLEKCSQIDESQIISKDNVLKIVTKASNTYLDKEGQAVPQEFLSQNNLNATEAEEVEIAPVTQTKLDAKSFFISQFNIVISYDRDRTAIVRLNNDGTGQVIDVNERKSYLQFKNDDSAFDLVKNQKFLWSHIGGDMSLDFKKMSMKVEVFQVVDSVATAFITLKAKNSAIIGEKISQGKIVIDKELQIEPAELLEFKGLSQALVEKLSVRYDQFTELTINSNGRGNFRFEVDGGTRNRPLSWSLENGQLSAKTYMMHNGRTEVSDSSCVRQGTCTIYRTYKFKALDRLEDGSYLVLREDQLGQLFDVDKYTPVTRMNSVSETGRVVLKLTK